MKKILLIGSYGASNLGDEALLEVCLKNFKNKAQISVLSGNPEDTIKRHSLKESQVSIHFPFGFRSLFFTNWKKSWNLLKNSDLVVFGGGGLFTDDYSFKAVLLWSWQIFLIQFAKKPYIFLGNSFGPLHSSLSKKLSAWALQGSSEVFVRDTISKALVEDLVPTKEVKLCSDLVFGFCTIPLSSSVIPAKAGIPCNSEEFALDGIPACAGMTRVSVKRKKVIAINIRDWRGDWKNSVKALVDFALEEGYGVIFIAMELEDAVLAHQFVQRHVSVVSPKNFQELLDILFGVEIAIGMRLHFLIAAALAGNRVAGISYSSKVEGVLEQIQVPFINVEEISHSKGITSLAGYRNDKEVDKIKNLFAEASCGKIPNEMKGFPTFEFLENQ